MKFEYLTTENGLSDNRVHAIYRDSRDFLWVGTGNKGLNRYDGNTVTIFDEKEDTPGSISNNAIRYIYEDSKRNLWIGTLNGLNLFDPKTQKFTVFYNEYADSSSNGNAVKCIYEDKDGNLWITYDDGGGINKYDYEGSSFVHYSIDEPGNNFDANSIISIKQDSGGLFWLVTRAPGLYKFDYKKGNFTSYCKEDIDPEESSSKTLFIDNWNNIWVGSTETGLYTFNPSQEKLTHYKGDRKNMGAISPYVNSIMQLDENSLLIGADQGGLSIYNFESGIFEHIVEDRRFANGLNCNGVLCLHKDKENILWIGTSRGGINFYNPKQSKFRLFENNIYNPNTLSYNVVGCFFEDSDGMIWIGTDGGGLNKFNPATGKFTIYKLNRYDPYSISGNVIRCISEDKDKNLWIGTWGSGLNRFDKRTGKFYRYYSDEKDSSSISSKTIWHLHVDSKNTLWLASYNRGIEIFDKDKGVVKRFTADPNVSNSLSSNNTRYIYEDEQHNIYICTDRGINLYDTISDSFITFDMFPDNFFWSICKDKKNRLWAGSLNKGLIHFNRNKEILEIYDKSKGLPDNNILAIVEDRKGYLWITTSRGISQVDPDKKKVKNFGKSDGLQGNLFFEQSFLKTRKGEIFFGGYKGFNSFFPDSIQNNDFIPKVYITGFKIFNKPVSHGAKDSPLEHHISETNEITLSWKSMVFSFEFVAINFTHPERNQYAYIMEGFEQEWNYVGNRKEATYTNMNPGEYTFRVIASNNDGVWNNEGASIRITILPPWWKTIWFRVFTVLTFIYLSYWAIKFRTSRLRNQKLLLANMVKDRTIQLERANTVLEEKKEEISLQNEQLQEQKEVLQNTNILLARQAKEIESKNIELNKHQNHLERLVEERTSELVIALKKVEESDKLKSAFLSNMSHEIRTPMNSIVGFSYLLTEPDIPEDEKALYVKNIKINSETLLVLINDILEMSRIQTNQIYINNESVDIIDLLEELNESFKIQIDPQKVQLIFDTKQYNNTLVCSADQYRLKQVLSNLISNALKFTESGFVKIGITKETNGFITFYVQDTGIGISKEVGNTIFERFLKIESTESKFYKGVGLGLAISYSLVQAMGGEIWYKSVHGQGTTFFFTIPHLKEKTDELPVKSVKHNIPDLLGKEILVVEDNQANYKLLACYIAKTKANVTWAVNGVEALKTVQNKNFDLILMDLKLPVMDGLEATRHIRRENPGQIIIAQTAFAFEEEKKKFMKLGFNGYLEKPIILEKLVEVLNDVFTE
jgi:signal transduction histidine kinase/ligand-binding sensor domain-containing protein